MTTVNCSHLNMIEILEPPENVPGCEDCLAIGSTWVHLRMCQTCGKIGCCDSSPNRHATQARPGRPPPRLPLHRARRGLELVRGGRGRVRRDHVKYLARRALGPATAQRRRLERLRVKAAAETFV